MRKIWNYSHANAITTMKRRENHYCKTIIIIVKSGRMWVHWIRPPLRIGARLGRIGEAKHLCLREGRANALVVPVGVSSFSFRKLKPFGTEAEFAPLDELRQPFSLAEV